jgi:hypothetical protein
MNINKLVRFANNFYSWAKSESLPEDSKDLKTILKNLDSLETFAARIKYAEKNLKHLSSGSSRIVYLTDDKTVVKLAKNERGEAQNKVESNPKMKSKYLNKILSKSSNNIWLETNFLDKITAKQFQELTKIDFQDFGDAFSEKNKKDLKKVYDSDIYKEMKKIIKNFNLLPGDISRISSWGVKDNQPILIDAGLSRKVFDDFYEDSSS